MTIAELFVQLGVKGADTAGKALGGVKNGLTEVKDMSLEAKAAIIGAIYALERMMSSSAKTGTALTDFNTITGVSTQNLQKWQYAAQQANNSAEDVAGSVKTLQDNMMKILQGQAAPTGWNAFQNFMSKNGQLLSADKMRDMDYMLHWTQKFAQAGPADVMKDKVMSLIGNEKIFAAMRMNAFRPEVENKAPTYSNNQIEKLNKVDVAWANLGTKVKMAFGAFTAKDGMKIVEWISLITDKVIKLADVLMKIADRFKIFEGITAAFGMMATVLDKVAEFGKSEGGEDSNLFKMMNSTNWDDTKKHFKAMLSDPTVGPGSKGERNWAAPTMKAGPESQSNNVNVNQVLNFHHDGKDAQKTATSVERGTTRAFQQIPARKGGQ